jgi:hypothetical protein
VNPNSSGSPNGRGGRGGSDPGKDKFDDKTQALPKTAQKSADGSDPSVAPESGLPPVIRKLQKLLQGDKFTPNVEKELGMTRDEAEQFVKKFENRKQPGPATPGQEIKVKPGEEKVFDPNRKAPEFTTSASVSERNKRTGGSLPQDNLGGLSEGAKSTPPPELRKQYEAYKKALSATRSRSSAASTPPAKP